MSIQQDLYLLDCATYEDYLNTFITRDDIRYIRNKSICRTLVELGFRSNSELYTPKKFEQRKAALIESLWPTKRAALLFSDGMTSEDPVLRELAAREKPNQQKILSTIIFLRSRLKNGFEVSGYKDYEHSLRRANASLEDRTDWDGVFKGRVTLRPKPTDLSYCNWYKDVVVYNDSDNFLVLHDAAHGLMFMHKGDHKKICVDISREMYKNQCTRNMYFSEKYGHVVFYDHIIRRKV